MILVFSTNENLPKVPADVQVYLNDLNAQGFLFDKMYVPKGEKDLEIHVYSTVQPGGVINTAVCMNEQMASRIYDWVKQLNA